MTRDELRDERDRAARDASRALAEGRLDDADAAAGRYADLDRILDPPPAPERIQLDACWTCGALDHDTRDHQ